MAGPLIDNNLIPYFGEQVQSAFRTWLRANSSSGKTFADFYWSKEWELDDRRKQRWIEEARLGFQHEQDRRAEERTRMDRDEERNQSRLRQRKTYTSFSGADIVASIRTVGGKPIVFGEIQTISYSIYRPMAPVYSLGRINPKGVVRGPRTIAGTMIFTVFDRHVLKQVMDIYRDQEDSFKSYFGLDGIGIDDLRKYAKTDEMPPFDINVSFLNEYGQSATLNIYGVHIMSEGQTMSIEDMITENTMQYIAMDIDLMDYGVGTGEDSLL